MRCIKKFVIWDLWQTEHHLSLKNRHNLRKLKNSLTFSRLITIFHDFPWPKNGIFKFPDFPWLSLISLTSGHPVKPVYWPFFISLLISHFNLAYLDLCISRLSTATRACYFWNSLFRETPVLWVCFIFLFIYIFTMSCNNLIF